MATASDSAESLQSEADSAYDHIVADVVLAAKQMDGGRKWDRYRSAVDVWADEAALHGDAELCLGILRHSSVGPDRHYRKFEFEASDPYAVLTAIAKSALVNDVDAQLQ